MPLISIPKNWMGVTLQEPIVKARLCLLNPDIHFDLGCRLNIWHPYRETRQSVFYLGRFITSMDRGTCPEVTVWTTKQDMVQVDMSDVRMNEIALQSVKGVRIICLKCSFHWIANHKPVHAVIGCPNGCENVAWAHDLTSWKYEDVFTGKAWVMRKTNDRVILVGWRHTLGKIAKAQIPGVTKEALERAFGVTLDEIDTQAAEVVESGEADFLNRVAEVA